MAHTDKFGRIWEFEPGHDTGIMLKLSNNVAAIGYNAHCALFTGEYEDRYGEYLKQYGELEPYLLKQPYGWDMGMRYGDEGYQYISPGIDQRIIILMIDLHRRGCSLKEFRVFFELISDPEEPK